VTVGPEEQLRTTTTSAEQVVWFGEPRPGHHLVQCSAHGEAEPAEVEIVGPDRVEVHWDGPHRRIAPGQSVVFYDGDVVVGGGVVGVGGGVVGGSVLGASSADR
jgi:tRNA-specific 2-thiouridylase